MTNYTTGHEAEKTAAEYLKQQGYKVVALNWRTKYCEIDIVIQKAKRVYFVEVKSRKTLFQGSGMDYITTKKLNQMRFAAEMWVTNHTWEGDYQLAALSIDNGNIQFVEIDT